MTSTDLAVPPPSEELTLYGFFAPDDIGVEDLSPPVSKVHAYLKLRKWPYKFVNAQVRLFKLTNTVLQSVRLSWSEEPPRPPYARGVICSTLCAVDLTDQDDEAAAREDSLFEHWWTDDPGFGEHRQRAGGEWHVQQGFFSCRRVSRVMPTW